MNPAPDWEALLAFDREHVWHPYATIPPPVAPLGVVSAEGVLIRLRDGNELVDGMSSWWCAIHGYRHPALDAAVRDQLGRMAHVMFGGLTHEPAITLARRLIAIAPPGLGHVFFADSGSVAVEVAIKMCLQAQRRRGQRGRTRLMTVRGGYHGDTFAAMAVCDPVGGMHSMFTGFLPTHVFADRPPGGFSEGLDEHWAAHVSDLIVRHREQLAAVIIEPIVQGAGGMRFYSPECVSLLRRLCDEHGILLILDEIATGFGRTGAMFAAEHAGVTPDVMCVGKALTGGYMTLAATLCTAEVARSIREGEARYDGEPLPGGELMHGPTFMANPLACAVSLASLDLLEGDRRAVAAVGRDQLRSESTAPDRDQDELVAAPTWRERVRAIERGLQVGLQPARKLPGVLDVRVLGAIGVIQMDRTIDIAVATEVAIDQGVWLRPFRDLIYAMPAYIMDEDDLARVTSAMVATAEAVAEG